MVSINDKCGIKAERRLVLNIAEQFPSFGSSAVLRMSTSQGKVARQITDVVVRKGVCMCVYVFAGE